MPSPKAESVDQYLSTLTPRTLEVIDRMRAIAKNAAPDAQEVISYGVLALKRKKILLYFGGYAQHVSIYPRSLALEQHFGQELAPFASGKGTLKFAVDEPLPWDLIGRIVVFMTAQP